MFQCIVNRVNPAKEAGFVSAYKVLPRFLVRIKAVWTHACLMALFHMDVEVSDQAEKSEVLTTLSKTRFFDASGKSVPIGSVIRIKMNYLGRDEYFILVVLYEGNDVYGIRQVRVGSTRCEVYMAATRHVEIIGIQIPDAVRFEYYSHQKEVVEKIDVVYDDENSRNFMLMLPFPTCVRNEIPFTLLQPRHPNMSMLEWYEMWEEHDAQLIGR